MKKFNTFDEAEEFLQPLMDSACAKIENSQTRRDHVLGLELNERLVYLIGTLNYQVQNGGFAQWRDNGYDTNGSLVINALKQVGGEYCLKAVTLVEGALGIDNEPEEDEWGNVDESEYDEIQEAFDVWDTKYYEIDDHIICELAEFLAAKQAA